MIIDWWANLNNDKYNTLLDKRWSLYREINI